LEREALCDDKKIKKKAILQQRSFGGAWFVLMAFMLVLMAFKQELGG